MTFVVRWLLLLLQTTAQGTLHEIYFSRDPSVHSVLVGVECRKLYVRNPNAKQSETLKPTTIDKPSTCRETLNRLPWRSQATSRATSYVCMYARTGCTYAWPYACMYVGR